MTDGGAKGGAALGAVGAGFIPPDWPILVGIAFGLVVGQIAAWAWEEQEGRPTGKRWLILNCCMWGLIFVMIMAAQEMFGWSMRITIAATAGSTFLGRDGILRWRKRALDKIEGGE